MRPVDFPEASDFIEKVRLKQETQRRRDIETELATIAKALENFDEKCDGDCCLRISDNDIDPFGIYEENLKIIGEKGWVVGFNERTHQYVFGIKGISSPNEV